MRAIGPVELWAGVVRISDSTPGEVYASPSPTEGADQARAANAPHATKGRPKQQRPTR